jgi:ABC-type bacteriocin/lantibiotic exporter with double-glycine peptidase domain
MKGTESINKLVLALWSHVNQIRRRQLFFMLGLTLICSLVEIISLGSVLPFIGILTQPEKVLQHHYIGTVLEFFNIEPGVDLVVPLAFGFALAAILANGLRLILSWVSIRLGNALISDIATDLFRRTLHQPYRIQVCRNSSEIISAITQKVNITVGVLISLMNMITSGILFFSILMTMFLVDPKVATVVLTSFGAAYLILAQLTRGRLDGNSKRIAKEQTQLIKVLQEGLSGIRDVLLDGNQQIFCDTYRKAILQYNRAGGQNTFIGTAPRYIMEALGMVLIATLVVLIDSQQGGVVGALPILGLLAIGTQRLLPLLQQLYGNWSAIAGSTAVVVDVLDLLSQPLPVEKSPLGAKELFFEKAIELRGVGFKYTQEDLWALDNVNLTISKGARLGIIGSTGAGKSTLVDLILGLLFPTKGEVMVDGVLLNQQTQKAWQRMVAHVPQNIFLADSTFVENIAFGVASTEINMQRVLEAAKQARISDFIESRPGGYDALVGERGIRLSGGQRQRIGIARALYKQATVFVFDEATSALDHETEESVMQAIGELSGELTIIIIAHRVTTLKDCTQIIELENGSINRSCNYQDIMSNIA